MADPFGVLDMAPSLLLDPEEIERRWREKTRAAHPDTGTASPEASRETAELNEARQRLVDPAGRLGAWLQRQGAENPVAPTLDPGLTAFFAEIGSVFTPVDELIDRRRQATTAIAKALLAQREVEAQLSLQEIMQSIQERRSAIEARFPAFEDDATQGRLDEASDALARLRFLQKWEAGCRERLLALLEE